MHIFNGGQDDALITVSGFGFNAFADLLELLLPV
jgi:hypothetical protein